MKNKKGFTLIELLVVISIIGILSTLSVVSLRSARGKARDAVKKSDLNAISTAIELYNIEESNYDIFDVNCVDSDTTVVETTGNTICDGNRIEISSGEILLQSIPVAPSDTYIAFVSANGYCFSVLLEDDETVFKCINGSCYLDPIDGVVIQHCTIAP